MNKKIITVNDYIAKYFRGNMSAFADSIGETRQVVRYWVKQGFYIYDGKILSPIKEVEIA